MRILVTGGAGFIGSNFVHYILRKHPSYEIVVLDKLTYAGRRENLEDIKDRITFIKGDITKRTDVEKAATNCDRIVNFAAETHVDRSIIEAGTFVQTDVIGTYTLLELARELGMSKFVQVSTDEVHGHIQKGSFNEDDALNPRNPYAASKAGAELLCNAYFQTYGLPVTATRGTNNYGAYQHPEKFIAKTIIYAILNRHVPVYGSGKNVRDWLYVEDHCAALDMVLHKGKNGETYNIASKQEMENVEVVKTVLKIAGKPERLIEFVKDRPGHDFRYSLDTRKIENELGWKAEVKFQEGIRKTIAWYTQNERWWKSILDKEQIDFYQKFSRLESYRIKSL